MRLLLPAFLALLAAPVAAQQAVDASPPSELAVTIYRDPARGEDEEMNRDWPQGFALVSETRTVNLPKGAATVRFAGVAEGMVAVSAIVTGLPGGVAEKNRNAALLSPGVLIDGTLGNRVTVTRINPATGKPVSQSAIVRTRADGGLVLETPQGFEALRCAGLPETLSFDRVPAGLSAEPVFSVDTASAEGGTFTVTLTYLAWGFDWEASYVARLREARGDGSLRMELMSWLTLLNDNGQSFADAQLMAVAGTLNVTSDFAALADAPEGKPLSLTCYPLGSTAAGSPLRVPPPPPPPPPPPAVSYEMADEAAIVVTASRMNRANLEAASPVSVIAAEEALGDLKLYRVPGRVTVAAKGQKQVAFLLREDVRARLTYTDTCEIHDQADDLEPAGLLLTTANSKARGLGQALPTGAITIYEPTSAGDLLLAETRMRDYALEQDVELDLPASTQVFAECGNTGKDTPEGAWTEMVLKASNANPDPVTVRFLLGSPADFAVSGLRDTRVKDGQRIHEITVPGNANRTVRFRMKAVG